MTGTEIHFLIILQKINIVVLYLNCTWHDCWATPNHVSVILACVVNAGITAWRDDLVVFRGPLDRGYRHRDLRLLGVMVNTLI